MWDVHYDYIPPEPYASMFDRDYAGALDGTDVTGEGFPLDATPRDVEHLRALYDGEIRFTDETIDHLLKMLDRAGLLDRTLVVVTSDHGEEFLDHGEKLHGRTLFEEVVHVPLILWARGGLPRGKAIATPVSLADVAPTILELLGLPALRNPDGVSLVPLLESRANAPDRPVFGEFYNPLTRALKLLSLRRGNEKLIYTPRRERWEMYDLASDATENRPGTPDPQLRIELAEFTNESQQLLASRAQQRRTKSINTIPPEVTERLRKLGYIK
jgi:arylsulfatase A-like enzyme